VRTRIDSRGMAGSRERMANRWPGSSRTGGHVENLSRGGGISIRERSSVGWTWRAECSGPCLGTDGKERVLTPCCTREEREVRIESGSVRSRQFMRQQECTKGLDAGPDRHGAGSGAGR